MKTTSSCKQVANRGGFLWLYGAVAVASQLAFLVIILVPSVQDFEKPIRLRRPL